MLGMTAPGIGMEIPVVTNFIEINQFGFKRRHSTTHHYHAEVCIDGFINKLYVYNIPPPR